MALSDLLQDCSNKSDTVMNKNVTRSTTRGCTEQYAYIMTVSYLLEQPCNNSDKINKVVTSC